MFAEVGATETLTTLGLLPPQPTTKDMDSIKIAASAIAL
jgi:hypothetical protein